MEALGKMLHLIGDGAEPVEHGLVNLQSWESKGKYGYMSCVYSEIWICIHIWAGGIMIDSADAGSLCDER